MRPEALQSFTSTKNRKQQQTVVVWNLNDLLLEICMPALLGVVMYFKFYLQQSSSQKKKKKSRLHFQGVALIFGGIRLLLHVLCCCNILLSLVHSMNTHKLTRHNNKSCLWKARQLPASPWTYNNCPVPFRSKKRVVHSRLIRLWLPGFAQVNLFQPSCLVSQAWIYEQNQHLLPSAGKARPLGDF